MSVTNQESSFIEEKADGVISQVDEPTEFVHSMVITTKAIRELRCCLNPKELMTVLEHELYHIKTREELAKVKYFSQLDPSFRMQVNLSRHSGHPLGDTCISCHLVKKMPVRCAKKHVDDKHTSTSYCFSRISDIACIPSSSISPPVTSDSNTFILRILRIFDEPVC